MSRQRGQAQKMFYGIPVKSKAIAGRIEPVYECPYCDKWVGRSVLRRHLKQGCTDGRTYTRHDIIYAQLGSLQLFLSPLNNRLYPSRATVLGHLNPGKRLRDKPSPTNPGKQILAIKSDKPSFSTYATRKLLDVEPELFKETIDKASSTMNQDELALFFGYRSWASFKELLGDLYFLWNIDTIYAKSMPSDYLCRRIGCLKEGTEIPFINAFDDDIVASSKHQFCPKCYNMYNAGELELMPTGGYLRRRT